MAIDEGENVAGRRLADDAFVHVVEVGFRDGDAVKITADRTNDKDVESRLSDVGFDLR